MTSPLRLTLIACLVSLLAFGLGCSDDDDDNNTGLGGLPGGGGGTPGTMTFTANGTTITDGAYSSTASQTGYLQIGTDVDVPEPPAEREMLLQIPIDSAAVGKTTTIDGSDFSFTTDLFMQSSTNDASTIFDSYNTMNGLAHGSMTITEIASGRIKGNFSAVLYRNLASPPAAESLKVENGTFDVPYTP